MSPTASPRFDGTSLTSDCSVNQVPIAPLAGAPADVTGHLAGVVLNRDAFLDLLQDAGVASDEDVETAAERAARALASPSSTERAAATRALATYGRRLGYLIATLRDPATAAAPGLTPARREFLTHWQGIAEVAVAGGLASGGLGDRLVTHADAALADAGAPPTIVAVSEHVAVAALVGAARSIVAPEGSAVVLDAGHTTLKSAVATFAAGRLQQVTLLTPASVTGWSSHVVADRVEDVVMNAFTAARATGLPVVPDVGFSVAAYVRDGRPIRVDRSLYEALIDPTSAIEQRVARSQGVDGVRFHYIHDGTAAWRATDRQPLSGIIVLGTWLGVGVGPQDAALSPVAPEFRVA